MKKVLVVDDELQVRELIKGVLTSAGFEVETAEDGISALEKMHAVQFQCVVTDLRMPRMDGRQLAEEIKRLFPQIPAIMVTGNLNLAEGAKVYRTIEKPISNFQELINLTKWLTGESMR